MKNTPPFESAESQALVNQVLIEYMREQKRKRRWRWIVRLAIIGLILYAIFHFNRLSDDDKPLVKPHVGLIDLNGNIFDTEGASADYFAKSIHAAYKNSGLKAVIFRINSPGGSPVQADYMYNTIKYYRGKFPDIKTYAVCVDICASAAYYVASAADEIYANPSSLVGSIGVLYNGFGFVDVMQKVGITRRLHTAGKNKGFLDPFSPETPEQVQILQTSLDNIHQTFINKVKEGRGERLKIDNDTFSGLFWTGDQAKTRGLIDGFGSSGQVARDIVKIEKIIDYTFKQSFLTRFSKNMGSAIADRSIQALGLKSEFLS